MCSWLFFTRFQLLPLRIVCRGCQVPKQILSKLIVFLCRSKWAREKIVFQFAWNFVRAPHFERSISFQTLQHQSPALSSSKKHKNECACDSLTEQSGLLSISFQVKWGRMNWHFLMSDDSLNLQTATTDGIERKDNMKSRVPERCVDVSFLHLWVFLFKSAKCGWWNIWIPQYDSLSLIVTTI